MGANAEPVVVDEVARCRALRRCPQPDEVGDPRAATAATSVTRSGPGRSRPLPDDADDRGEQVAADQGDRATWPRPTARCRRVAGIAQPALADTTARTSSQALRNRRQMMRCGATISCTFDGSATVLAGRRGASRWAPTGAPRGARTGRSCGDRARPRGRRATRRTTVLIRERGHGRFRAPGPGALAAGIRNRPRCAQVADSTTDARPRWTRLRPPDGRRVPPAGNWATPSALPAVHGSMSNLPPPPPPPPPGRGPRSGSGPSNRRPPPESR